jgi:hypothetical protein
MKEKMRRAATVLRTAVRAEIVATFSAQGHRSGTHLLRRKTSISIRSKRGRVRAEVGPKGIAGVYGRVHEKGLTVTRRSRSGGEHQAVYPKREFIAPAVKKTDRQIFAILGQSFRVV